MPSLLRGTLKIYSLYVKFALRVNYYFCLWGSVSVPSPP